MATAKITKGDFEEVRQAHYRKCRALGHEWQHDAVQFEPATNSIVAISACLTCTTERTKRIAMSGKTKLKYGYAAGYLANTGVDERGVKIPAKKPWEWRREFVMHTVNHDDVKIA